jgi:hypothetical protein
MSRCNESVSLFACEVSESQNRTHSALDQISSLLVFELSVAFLTNSKLALIKNNGSACMNQIIALFLIWFSFRLTLFAISKNYPHPTSVTLIQQNAQKNESDLTPNITVLLDFLPIYCLLLLNP